MKQQQSKMPNFEGEGLAYSPAYSKELCSKMALVEVLRRVTPMMMPRSCPSSSRLLKTFFQSHNFS